jgi:6-phosphogluconolactonase
VFAIDPVKGTLTNVGFVPTQGKTPRHFAIDPTGRWLFAENQDSDNIVIFRINEKTGLLTSQGEPLGVPSPVCVKFVPLN